MQRFFDQAKQAGAEYIMGEVTGIEPQAQRPAAAHDNFLVHYGNNAVSAKAIILAFGLAPRSLGVPGEVALVGKGVIYSTLAALPDLQNKNVVVVGGGNSAIEAVNNIAPVAKQVYLVHRRDQFRAEAALLTKFQQQVNVKQCLNAQVTAIHGQNQVTGVTVQYHDGRSEEITADAVCVHIGFMSKTNYIESLVALNEKKEIIVQPSGETNTPGVFAAGDSTAGGYKQVIVSAGDGCKAALACYAYLMQQAGKTVTVDQDWNVTSGQHFIRT